MKKCGIIDVGSNSIRMGLYDYDENGFTMIDNYLTVKELVTYIENGQISEKGLEIAYKTLYSFKDIANNRGVTDLYALITAPGRKVDDPSVFVNKLSSLMPIELLSAEQEATYAFKGAKCKVDLKQGMTIDIGGGSSEIVQFENDDILYETSLDVGCVALSKIDPKEPLFYVEDILKKMWEESVEYSDEKFESLSEKHRLNGFYLQELIHCYAEKISNTILNNI